MANFSVSNSTTPAGSAQLAINSSYTTLIGVAASSGNFTNTGAGAGPLRRGKLYDILIGTNGTPADNYLEWSVFRTTLGTTTTWVGSISSVSSAYDLDLADSPFGAFVTLNTTANSSTVSSVLTQAWYVGINQRASYRWVAAPGSEIVYPANSSATGNNGLSLAVRSGGYVGTATGNLMINEQ